MYEFKVRLKGKKRFITIRARDEMGAALKFSVMVGGPGKKIAQEIIRGRRAINRGFVNVREEWPVVRRRKIYG